MSFWQMHNRVRFASDGSMAAGAGSQQTQNNQNAGNQNSGGNQNSQQNKQGQNNGEVSWNPWQPASSETAGGNQNGQGNQNNSQNNQNNQNNGQHPNISEAFKRHIEGLDFSPGNIDLDKILNEKDVTGLQNAMKEVGAKAYQHALQDAHKMMKPAIERAVKAAVAEATGTMRSEGAIGKMHAELKFTQHDMIKPVAESVFARAMQQNGNNEADAIKKVRAYFENSTKGIADDLGLEVSPKTSQKVRGRQSTEGNVEDWTSWLTEPEGVN